MLSFLPLFQPLLRRYEEGEISDPCAQPFLCTSDKATCPLGSVCVCTDVSTACHPVWMVEGLIRENYGSHDLPDLLHLWLYPSQPLLAEQVLFAFLTYSFSSAQSGAPDKQMCVTYEKDYMTWLFVIAGNRA